MAAPTPTAWVLLPGMDAVATTARLGLGIGGYVYPWVDIDEGVARLDGLLRVLVAVQAQPLCGILCGCRLRLGILPLLFNESFDRLLLRGGLRPFSFTWSSPSLGGLGGLASFGCLPCLLVRPACLALLLLRFPSSPVEQANVCIPIPPETPFPPPWGDRTFNALPPFCP